MFIKSLFYIYEPNLLSLISVYNSISIRTLHGFASFANKHKEYNGKKLIGYSMDQMYQVVSDVENYKNFVPFCKKSIVMVKRPDHLKASLVIGFPPILESYTSHVQLDRPHLVKAICKDGRLFDHLTTTWKFSPGLRSIPQSCILDFYVSFQFKSALHSHMAHIFFNEIIKKMEWAFVQEAQNRYGKPALESKKIVLT